jgi:hypothetical protein
VKQTFQEINFKPKSLELIEICNEILRGYEKQNLRLTLRQL